MKLAVLSKSEQESLDGHEKTIGSRLSAFIEVGEALAHIKQERLYRDTHKTFEAYCSGRWGWGSGRARQIMGAADTAKSVKGLAVLNERQARELSKVEPSKRKEVAAEASKAPGGLTAKTIATAARRSLPIPVRPSKPTVPDSEEFKEKVRTLQAVRRWVEVTSEKAVGRELRRQQIVRDIDNAVSAIKFAVPAKACPCKGEKDSCRYCHGDGWVTQEQWDRIPDKAA